MIGQFRPIELVRLIRKTRSILEYVQFQTDKYPKYQLPRKWHGHWTVTDHVILLNWPCFDPTADHSFTAAAEFITFRR